MLFKFAPVAMIFMLGACAGKQPLDASHADALNGKRLAIAVDKNGGLSAQTGGKVLLLGGLSGFAAAADGNDILKKNNVPDPAVSLVHGLAEKLSHQYGMQVMTPEPLQGMGDADYIKAVQAAGGADYLLVTQQPGASVMYYLTDMNNYIVRIGLAARLVNMQTGENVYKGLCQYTLEYDDADMAPSWKDLFDNGAAGYKEQVKAAERHCLAELGGQL